MGNRGSITVVNQQTGKESVVLFRHICGDLQGMEALVEEAVFTDDENIFSRQDPPEIIAHLCAVSRPSVATEQKIQLRISPFR
jgi:hypothetical protein